MTNSKAPWHHWPVAIAALIFYGLAVLDYVAVKLGIAAYLNFYSAELLQFVRDLPLWLSVLWAVTVWSGLAGAWLLYRRNRWSVLLLFTGFACMTFLTVWWSLFTRPTLMGLAGFTGLYLMAGSSALAFLFYVYGRWERTVKKL
ncbi:MULTISPECIES: hypothetical protein [unclassified Meridianimarinicoccus]|uniref:hypothetical protein n=1 Tax=unclassified Meridianimarinicoccus TaxID=2923344 RepID=UPI00186849C5|nr:hypothetical protein [Fluviibacterium sp. MJW13]